jgi:hypothetical protein
LDADNIRIYPLIPEVKKLLMKVLWVARKNTMIGAQTKSVAAIRRLQSEPLSGARSNRSNEWRYLS